MSKAPRCPTCLRPVFVPRPPTDVQPDPLRHCPRALETLASGQEYVIACMAIGLAARDAALGAALTRTRQLLAVIDDVLADPAAEEADHD